MKKLVLSIAIAAISLSAFAQRPRNNFNESNLGTYDRITTYGPYLTNRFGDNWFIGVAAGAGVYFGNEDCEGDFGDRIAPVYFEISLGKWITPSVGLRAQFSRGQAKGFSTTGLGEFASATPNSDELYEENFKMWYAHGDLLWNISNAIGGFRSDRFWNFVPNVGFGIARAYKGDYHTAQPAMHVGLLNNIRLGGVVDLTLEAKHMFVKNSFNGEGRFDKFEGMTTLTAGLTFKLGPKEGFKRPVYNAPADYTPYENRISRLQSDLNEANARIDRLTRELEECRNRPASVEKIFTPVTISSFFRIGKANVSETDMANLETVSNVIKSNPDGRFNVTGYADSSTGSARLNQELSNKRAEAVANVLVNQFGVNRSQLNISGRGGVANHTNPILDRVVVID